MSLLVSEHTFTNTTESAILFSLSDSAIHKVTNVIEEAVRIHEAQQLVFTEIQDWSFLKGAWEGSYFQQNSTIEPVIAQFATDALPPDTILTDWTTKRITDEGGGEYISRSRTVKRWLTIVGPLNSKKEITESKVFPSERFEVLNGVGENKISINGWYRILPGAVYTIKRYVKTPIMNYYNDTLLLGDFISATPLRIDNMLSWKISNPFNINLVHDIGFEKAIEMVPLTVSEGIGSTTYPVSRVTSSL